MIAGDIAALAVPVDKLHTLPGNPRRGDVGAVARSLERFGQLKPIVATPDGTVVAGNHTLAAALQLGWDEIAVNWADLDEATAKAYALADNRTAELGGYDDSDLAALIAEVRDFDEALLADTGWTDDDLARLVGTTDTPADPSSDEIPEWAPAKTARGDVWLLGPHRVMCGDCREPTDVDRLLAGAAVNLAFTSPPYAQQRDYDPESEFRPIPPDEYVEWFTMVQANVAAHLAGDGSWFVNIKEHAEDGQRVLYVKDLTCAHVRTWGWRFVDEFCWRRWGVPGRWSNRFKNSWEPVFHYTRQSDIKFRPDAVAVESDDVFDYSPDNPKTHSGFISGSVHGAQGRLQGMALPGNVVSIGNAKADPERGHTAEFPVALPQWFVKAFSDPGDTVFDPFMGSGSTLLAAYLEDRVGYGMEISPKYVDVICKRFQLATGIRPIAEATGVEHDFCEDDG